jgi:hypothetical protein
VIRALNPCGFLIGLASCTPPAGPLAGAGTDDVPRDFAFVFEYGACARHTFDAARGTLTVKQGDDWQRSARVSLDADEVQEAYRKIEGTELWSYPTEYRLEPASEDAYYIDPHPSYRLEVTSRGRTNAVSWSDPHLGPVSAEGERLRGLAQLIEDMIEEKEGSQRLAHPPGLCL